MSSSTTKRSRPAPAKWFLTLDDQRVSAPRRVIGVAVIRAQAAVPSDRVIVRDHNSPDDEVLDDHAEVDLSVGNVFYTLPRCDAPAPKPCATPTKVAFSIDDRVEEAFNRQQTGGTLLDLFGLDRVRLLFRDHESPVDEPIKLDEPVRYEDGPVFFSRHQDQRLVEISIDRKTFAVKPGEHTVTALKTLVGVPAADELEQVINGKLTPLPDDGNVHIKGGEVFISHPRSGGSS